jgi:16S rRNA (cytidine1402-2'-O)-methyltransferase
MSSPLHGILYVVSTPIGNEDDLSPRAVRMLNSVTLIAAEDPGVTKALLDRHGVETPLTSYHAPDLEQKVHILLQRLQDGQDIALVCDAGTPVIGDPGARLVEQAIAVKVPVVPVPGVSAVVAAIPVSGLRDRTFFFQGPLPHSKATRRRLLQGLHRQQGTLVFFEDARRLRGTLEEMRATFGDRRVVVAESLTKPEERILRGRVDEVLRDLVRKPATGEITLLIEGPGGKASKAGHKRKRR